MLRPGQGQQPQQPADPDAERKKKHSDEIESYRAMSGQQLAAARIYTANKFKKGAVIWEGPDLYHSNNLDPQCTQAGVAIHTNQPIVPGWYRRHGMNDLFDIEVKADGTISPFPGSYTRNGIHYDTFNEGMSAAMDLAITRMGVTSFSLVINFNQGGQGVNNPFHKEHILTTLKLADAKGVAINPFTGDALKYIMNLPREERDQIMEMRERLVVKAMANRLMVENTSDGPLIQTTNTIAGNKLTTAPLIDDLYKGPPPLTKADEKLNAVTKHAEEINDRILKVTAAREALLDSLKAQEKILDDPKLLTNEPAGQKLKGVWQKLADRMTGERKQRLHGEPGARVEELKKLSTEGDPIRKKLITEMETELQDLEKRRAQLLTELTTGGLSKTNLEQQKSDLTKEVGKLKELSNANIENADLKVVKEIQKLEKDKIPPVGTPPKSPTEIDAINAQIATLTGQLNKPITDYPANINDAAIKKSDERVQIAKTAAGSTTSALDSRALNDAITSKSGELTQVTADVTKQDAALKQVQELEAKIKKEHDTPTYDALKKQNTELAGKFDKAVEEVVKYTSNHGLHG